MATQDFDRLLATGLLRDVEEMVVDSYMAVHEGATRPDAYHWLRYEDPDPVARLEDGVRELVARGVRFDAKAVDKACEEASKLGYSN